MNNNFFINILLFATGYFTSSVLYFKPSNKKNFIDKSLFISNINNNYMKYGAIISFINKELDFIKVFNTIHKIYKKKNQKNIYEVLT